MNNKQARDWHQMLDRLAKGETLSPQNVESLRELLPELPKQKTLEEIAWDMDFAWAETSGNDWKEDMFGNLETWLSELHSQLRAHLEGVKSEAHPALPAGMRIAVHAVYGRVVVSPVVDDDGTCKIFHLSTQTRDGSDYCWAPIDSLTFIDYEPAKPAPPTLPAGMRLADHKNFGRVVVATDWNNHHGEHFCVFFNNSHGCVEYSYLSADHLTFVDAEPAKPAHPEFLETEGDYENAPEGTIVACEDSSPWYKSGPEWLSVDFCGAKDDKGMSRARRRVLRWGNE